MPRPHIAMRKIRDALRLRFGEGLSVRQVAASLQLPFTTVGDHLRRAERAGLKWPLPDELDDEALEARLFPASAPASEPRPRPEWEKIHVELRRPPCHAQAAVAGVSGELPRWLRLQPVL